MFKKIKQNEKRLIIVGDVHGCLTKLLDALDSVGYNPITDLLIFTGDFIDRGPQNLAVLEWVSVLLEKGLAHAVLGNHDEFLVEWADSCIEIQKDPSNFMPLSPEYHSLWMNNGGSWAANTPIDLLLQQAEWLSNLPYMLEIELDTGKTAGVVHAELWHSWDITIDLLAHAGVKERLIWGRQKINQFLSNQLVSTTTGVDYLFCGHSVVTTPTKVGNQYYLDTGAVFDTLYPTEIKGAFSFGIIKPNSDKVELVKCLT